MEVDDIKLKIQELKLQALGQKKQGNLEQAK